MDLEVSESQTDTPVRAKSAKRKLASQEGENNADSSPSSAAVQRAPKRSKRDAMGNYIAKKKQYDKKIKHEMQKYARPGPQVSISVCIFSLARL